MIRSLSADPTCETLDLDHSKLVETSRDQLLFVTSFELKSNQGPFGADDACKADYGLPKGRGRQMTDLNLHSHRTLARLQSGHHRLARCVLQEPDQPGRGKDRRHTIAGKVDRVLRFNNESLLARRANLWIREHGLRLHPLLAVAPRVP